MATAPKSAKKDVTKSKTLSSTLRATTPGGHEGGMDEASLRIRNQMLEKDLERRQESYIARERAYKARIEDLEEELNNQKALKTGWMKSDTKMQKLKNVHAKILDNIELVQDRTARILQDQERDLLRAFRARLFDVQTELEKEKSKKDDGAGAWIERSRQLESEVEWAKEVADRLERVNQALTQENSRLKAQFQSQEEDRNFLIQQLVAVKKDNERLRQEYAAIDAENKNLLEQRKTWETQKTSTTAVGSGGMTGGKTLGVGGNKGGVVDATAAVGAAAEERYKEVNVRLRRLLAEERKALALTRQNYAAELRARTEMELLLRQCVEDVRKEIAKKHIETNALAAARGSTANLGDFTKLYQQQVNGGSATIPVEDFTQEDRERVLELLLSQERVVTLLYARAFPMHTTTPSNNAAGAKAGGLLGVVEDETAVRPGSTGGGGGLTGGGLNNSSSEKLLPLINNGSNNPRPRTGGN